MDNITISRDEYDALCALRTRVTVFETLAREKQYIDINEALLILGYEPIEEEKCCTMNPLYMGKTGDAEPDADSRIF